jgi:hypothetical protein
VHALRRSSNVSTHAVKLARGDPTRSLFEL